MSDVGLDILHWKLKKKLGITKSNNQEVTPQKKGNATQIQLKPHMIQEVVVPSTLQLNAKQNKVKSASDNDTKRLLEKVPKQRPKLTKADFKETPVTATIPKAMLASDYNKKGGTELVIDPDKRKAIIKNATPDKYASDMVITNNYAKYINCVASGIKYTVKAKVNTEGYIQMHVYENAKGKPVFETYYVNGSLKWSWIDVYPPTNEELANEITYVAKIEEALKELQITAVALNTFDPNYILRKDVLERARQQAYERALEAYASVFE
jgi:hypothetical protein